MSRSDYLRYRQNDGIGRIILDREARHNALDLTLVSDLAESLDEARKRRPSALVISSSGPNFSTGGDLEVFLDAYRDGSIAHYSGELVARLNDVVLALLALPFPVIVVARGAATGGAAGLIFAADFVLCAENAFLQPYYSEVGFAPDGGWTALLPDIVGRRRASSILIGNRRIEAVEAVQLGIADAAVTEDRLERELASLIDTINHGSEQSFAATKRLLNPRDARSRIAAALERERQEFLALVARAETRERIENFLAAMSDGKTAPVVDSRAFAS